ncbi:hypothetical protein R4B61_05185 [Fructilactobacillus vespulae]|uniref:hypothetical protein n=1 Tax=Fructilactobacillus vespulae TaxID=1249630 RepID=UPI0039B6E8F0
MLNKKIIMSAILSAIGTTTYLISKKQQKENQQKKIRLNLIQALNQKFGKENINGYWIDFDNSAGLEYPGGVNIKKADEKTKETYTFLFNIDSNEIYSLKMISSLFD